MTDIQLSGLDRMRQIHQSEQDEGDRLLMSALYPEVPMIQLSEAACESFKPTLASRYWENMFFYNETGNLMPDTFDPQDWGRETFSDDTLERYPPL